jgi:hypothetical protein
VEMPSGVVQHQHHHPQHRRHRLHRHQQNGQLAVTSCSAMVRMWSCTVLVQLAQSTSRVALE